MEKKTKQIHWPWCKNEAILYRALTISVFQMLARPGHLPLKQNTDSGILNINYTTEKYSASQMDHKTNEFILHQINKRVDQQELLLSIVRRRTLQWYGHTLRNSIQAKKVP